MLLSLVVAAGVLIANGIIISSFAIHEGDIRLPDNTLQTVLIQFMWALVTGPLLLMIFRFCQNRLDDITAGLFSRRGNHGT